MHFFKAAVLVLLPLIGTVFALPTRRDEGSGTIILPTEGTIIGPGEVFDFEYNGMADFGISSYNFTVWLLTAMPTSVAPSINFAQGHYFGRFSLPNFPGNPNPKNLAPKTLTMPDFSKPQGGFGSGASASDGHFTLVVMEEYGTGDATVGNRITLAMTGIVYNATLPA
ncbi:hypothetical protein C8J57DRAFT_509705 [Mycena rebaudengoi]|nr:hypothetical protein C8J57DRAFT_509705 [Mycena rebaudengoi]